MPKKSRRQKRQAKIQKRQQRRVRRSSSPSRPSPSLGGLPFFDDEPVAPAGFRPISATQAMMEYATPIMAYVDDGVVEDMNEALQVSVLLWNSTLPEAPAAARQSREAIVSHIETTLQLDRQDAEAFYDQMIARKTYLFPDDMQPNNPMTMFMRKDVAYLITPFEESQLHVSDEIIPPNADDATFVKALEELEARLDFGEEYGEWEDDFFAMKELCCERYRDWLRAKGVPETFSQQLSCCIDPYLSFIYQYDAGSVLDVLPYVIEEFFMDWLMRKVMVKPPEYTQWPPALRLFYRFLFEKGSLDDPKPILAGLYDIEPAFIALVKKRS